ncbi:hypothetical protein KEM56_002953 [Ascosphaera pollenicola]|nr:hypothetical protein KEM56_002953 [Ascosphaera pollenicola]
MTVPPPSAVTSFIALSAAPEGPASAVAAQVLHNLQHQHLWTDLQSHNAFSLSPTQHAPLVLGRPPQTVYTHPDEQAYMVQHGIKVEDVPVETEWVLPTAQGQTWSLRRLAEIFDALPDRSTVTADSSVALGSQNQKVDDFYRKRHEEGWNVKRLLLAMINTGMDGDGTVVYYVVLEGAIKPRQN